MSKAVKTVIGVAAAIAIPFAAPYIASSIGMSAAIGTAVGSATAGSVIGGAVTGAALGAAKASIMGEDVNRGALMGGLGGGIGGYTAAPTSSIPQASINAANATSDPIAALNASQGFTDVNQGYMASIGAAGAPVYDVNAAGQVVPAPEYAAPTAGLDTTGLASAVTPATAAAPTAGAGAGAGAGAAAQPGTFSEALRAKLTDPKNLADFTLRAAGQLAGSALAGSGLSDEEQALLNQQTEELRNLQQTNQSLFNQRLEQAQSLIGESRYFDPEYFGLQSARRQQVAGAQQRRAGLRGLTGEARESAGRKYDLGTARNVGTAYDTGFASAVGPRLQTMQAGLSAMPTSGPSNAAAYNALQQTYTAGRQRQRQTQQDIGTLFGSLTGKG
jgi:hypothetical protein